MVIGPMIAEMPSIGRFQEVLVRRPVNWDGEDPEPAPSDLTLTLTTGAGEVVATATLTDPENGPGLAEREILSTGTKI